ncbi:MAG: hypothetical protein ACHQVK_04100, partial [Candidatus Paceibacterales bacterium]
MDLNFRTASEIDNKAILGFYNNCPIVGKSIQLRSHRGDDFFKFLKYQAEDYKVFVYEQKGEVQGVGTVLIRNGYINRSIEKVSYFGDLRVGSREAIKAWRDIYGEILRKWEYPVVTAVIDENQAAQKALINSQKSDVIYEKLAQYRMVNILGKKPWRKISACHLDCLEIREANSGDQEDLINFLDKQNRMKEFGYCFNEGELQR